MGNVWKLGCAFIALGLSACSPSDPATDAGVDDAAADAVEAAATCDRTLPTCPATPPSYAQTVAPIVHDRCVPCHFPGSMIAKIDLSTYSGLYANRGSALNQVYSCAMPADGGTPLTVEERTTLMTWLVCGAPNN